MHKCEHENSPNVECGGTVELRGAMTAYHYSEEDRLAGKPDPNPSFYACESHYEDYVSHWKDMWDEYYSNIRG